MLDQEYTQVEMWYDRKTRSWVVQRKDKEGNQVGEAYFSGTKTGARLIRDEWRRELKNTTWFVKR